MPGTFNLGTGQENRPRGIWHIFNGWVAARRNSLGFLAADNPVHFAAGSWQDGMKMFKVFQKRSSCIPWRGLRFVVFVVVQPVHCPY